MKNTQLPSTTTRILLSHTKWDKQELLYRLTGDDRDKFFEEAHVQNPFKKKVMRRTRSKVTCSICYSDFPKKVFLSYDRMIFCDFILFIFSHD